MYSSVIKKYPNKILRTACDPVQQEELEPLAKRMLEEYDRIDRGNAIGLAAPQIGIPLQSFVVGSNVLCVSEPTCWFNPRVLEMSATEIEEKESCLSLPDVSIVVRRARSIVVNLTNRVGGIETYTVEGYNARVLQHEIDHVNGKLIVDFLSKNRRLRIAEQMSRR